jgi:hypothetical protein
MSAMIQPILLWEEDLWPVFDRLKAAMDKQEQARVAGRLDEFVAQGAPLFEFLEGLTFRVWMTDKVKTSYVYLSWKASRGIDSWLPDRDLPLRWFLAEQVPVPVPQAEAMEAIKAKHRHWAFQNLENKKFLKQEYKRIEREQKAKEPKRPAGAKAKTARKKAS